MIKLGVVMDPIGSINPKKDSTLAMLIEAQARSWQLYYMEQRDLYLKDNRSCAHMQRLKVHDDPNRWYELTADDHRPLADLDVILMRKDPPFDIEYIYTTHLLELAEREDVLVVNSPQALRDANEKLSTAWFPQCTAPCLVTRDARQIRSFIAEQRDIILKPLSAMGGESIFRVRQDEPNINVIIEVMTEHGKKFVMAQRYIPEISEGDIRILLIDGEAVPYALARIAAPGETRANLATGGTGVGVQLSERQQWICSEVGPKLKAMGLIFVGLDVIGDFLTEINVTSPTCVRELDALYDMNISAILMDKIEARLA
jgi:glutathione synthase